VYFQQASLIHRKLLLQRKDVYGLEDEIDRRKGAGDARAEARASVIDLFEQFLRLKITALTGGINAGLMSIVEARQALLTMVKSDRDQIVADKEHLTELNMRLDKLRTFAHAEDADGLDDRADLVSEMRLDKLRTFAHAEGADDFDDFAEEFAEEDKLAKERIDARNAFDGYIHSMKSAVEGSGDNKGLGEKMDEDEKETIEDAIKDGQDWLSSNPEADAEEIKEKQKEIEGICSPIIQKYYQGSGGGGESADDDDDDDEAHDEL